MTDPRDNCPVCSEPILPGDPVSFEHGELMHMKCAERRKPGARAEPRQSEPPGDTATA